MARGSVYLSSFFSHGIGQIHFEPSSAGTSFSGGGEAQDRSKRSAINFMRVQSALQTMYAHSPAGVQIH